MRRSYKLILIIIISIILAYLIYIFNKEDKINIVALGDGVSSGETSYNIDGISYNDYIKEHFFSNKKLKNYNNTFSKRNYKISELIIDLNSNVYDKKKDIYLKQLLHEANIITLAIGEDELTKNSITGDLNEEVFKKYINDFNYLIKNIKEITESKIIIIGLYKNNNLKESDVIIVNAELANIANEYEVIFINIADLMLNKDYFLNKSSYYFNYRGHEDIAEIIIHSI